MGKKHIEQTNLLGRKAIVNKAQGPVPESAPIGKRVGQNGEVVTVERLDGQLYLGVLWPDGQITSWPANFFEVVS